VTKSTKSRNGTTDPAPRDASEAPAPLKRFRIEKLEERIAPAKGGKGTHNCGSGGGGSSASSGFSGTSIF
jgi:hypothetical protein